jgi:hypothetical protein
VLRPLALRRLTFLAVLSCYDRPVAVPIKVKVVMTKPARLFLLRW